MSPPERKRDGVGVVLIVTFLMLVLYVLSIGPVAFVASRLRHHTFNRAAETFYAPLIWLSDHTPLGGPLKWYVHLFK